jgi:hypothetical protein
VSQACRELPADLVCDASGDKKTRSQLHWPRVVSIDFKLNAVWTGRSKPAVSARSRYHRPYQIGRKRLFTDPRHSN